ncbi:MAG: hypothetical protein GX073_01260 [Firmicutes bacterium]|nr:hypothetical protein [Bacillota bacterium]
MWKELGNLLITLFCMVVNFIVLIMPDRLRPKLGERLGKLLLKTVSSYTETAREGMELVFKDELTPEEIERLIEANFVHMGLVIVEFMLAWRINRKNFRQYANLTVEGEEYLRAAHRRGKGIILYTAHLGNWEWLGGMVSFLGYPLTAIVQRQHNRSFDWWINKLRRSKGVRILYTRKMSQRDAYLALKNNECLFLLGDQYPLSNGWPVTFFNQPTYAFAGVVRFAEKTGASIVPAFLVREGWRKHRLIFGEPYQVEKGLPQAEKEQLLQELTTLLEKMIRKYPEQWLWIHKRWRPEDGKE